MISDPIVEDVYQARQKILDQCNGDLTQWIQRLRAAEAQHRDRVVSIAVVREKCQHERNRHLTKRR